MSLESSMRERYEREKAEAEKKALEARTQKIWDDHERMTEEIRNDPDHPGRPFML